MRGGVGLFLRGFLETLTGIPPAIESSFRSSDCPWSSSNAFPRRPWVYPNNIEVYLCRTQFETRSFQHMRRFICTHLRICCCRVNLESAPSDFDSSLAFPCTQRSHSINSREGPSLSHRGISVALGHVGLCVQDGKKEALRPSQPGGTSSSSFRQYQQL